MLLFRGLGNKSKNGKQSRKQKHDDFMMECAEHFKEMHKCCLDVLCQNAYNCGRAELELFDVDGYTEVEALKIKVAYLEGKVDGICGC